MPALKLYDRQDIIWRGATQSRYRNLLFVGGIQCGKTTLGAALVTRAAHLYRNPEETGIIAAPTYKILQQATLPKFLSFNQEYGVYNKSQATFTYHWGFTVYLRTATKPESMEGIPNCRFVWLDEGGLVPRYFYENCMGRVARLQGPIIVTTTPYALNWLSGLANETLKGKRDDTLMIQVRSVDSPYFPKEEFDRQQKLLDPRRFAMKYMGQFGKMQGLVFPDIPLARMVAGKRRDLVFPVRWFNIGNRFRYERPQRGRMREFFQIDVDVVGIADARADGEIIVLASEVLKALGASAGDFTIRISSRKLLNAATEALGYSADEAKQYLRLLDRKDKMSAEEFEEQRAPMRRDGKDPLELIEEGAAAIVEEKEKLQGLLAAFEARGMNNVVFDPTIVRGFDYYTGTVFEVYDTNPENPRAMFGGGRYDNLLSLFGSESIPAMGFAIGDVVLLDFLTTHGYAPKATSAPLVFLGTPSEEDIAAAQEFATTLREEGHISVLVNVTDKSLGDQIREANKRGIPYFIAYGKNEAESGMVKLKSLDAVEEKEMTAAEALDVLTHIKR
jgi:histidyl-tRNA synthetase